MALYLMEVSFNHTYQTRSLGVDQLLYMWQVGITEQEHVWQVFCLFCINLFVLLSWSSHSYSTTLDTDNGSFSIRSKHSFTSGPRKMSKWNEFITQSTLCFTVNYNLKAQQRLPRFWRTLELLYRSKEWPSHYMSSIHVPNSHICSLMLRFPCNPHVGGNGFSGG